MEVCELNVSSAASAARRPGLRRKIALGVSALLASGGGGLVYGATRIETDVAAFVVDNNLTAGVERAVTSLPSPAIVPIVLDEQAVSSSIQSTADSAGHACLPLPETLGSANSIGQTLSGWGTQVEQGSQITNLLAHLTAQLQATPWPEIHGRAQLARVPVMMYHDVLPEKEVFFDITPER